MRSQSSVRDGHTWTLRVMVSSLRETGPLSPTRPTVVHAPGGGMSAAKKRGAVTHDRGPMRLAKTPTPGPISLAIGTSWPTTARQARPLAPREVWAVLIRSWAGPKEGLRPYCSNSARQCAGVCTKVRAPVSCATPTSQPRTTVTPRDGVVAATPEARNARCSNTPNLRNWLNGRVHRNCSLLVRLWLKLNSGGRLGCVARQCTKIS